LSYFCGFQGFLKNPKCSKAGLELSQAPDPALTQSDLGLDGGSQYVRQLLDKRFGQYQLELHPDRNSS